MAMALGAYQADASQSCSCGRITKSIRRVWTSVQSARSIRWRLRKQVRRLS